MGTPIDIGDLAARVKRVESWINIDVASRMDRLEGSIRDVMAHREQEQRFQAACAAMTGLLANPEIKPRDDATPEAFMAWVAMKARGHANGLMIELGTDDAPAPQPPEPVEIPGVIIHDGPFKMGAAIAAISDVVDAVDGPVWKVAVDDQQRAVERIREIVDQVLGPQSPPADGLEPDWWWRHLDPDDAGDSPGEALRHVPDYCACHLGTSLSLGDVWAVRVPTLSDDDDTEVLQFETEDAAMAAAKERHATLEERAKEGDDNG